MHLYTQKQYTLYSEIKYTKNGQKIVQLFSEIDFTNYTECYIIKYVSE